MAPEEKSSKERLRQRLVQAGKASQLHIALGGSGEAFGEGSGSFNSKELSRSASRAPGASNSEVLQGALARSRGRTVSHLSHLSATSADSGSIQSSLDPFSYEEILADRSRTGKSFAETDRSRVESFKSKVESRASRMVRDSPLTAERALAALPIFKGCRENFINHLASSGEHLMLKPGEFRDLRGQKSGPGEGQAATAVVVLSGTFRLEISGVVAEELTVGQAFGFADVLAAGSESYSQKSGAGGTRAVVSLRATAKAEARMAFPSREQPRGSMVRAPWSCFLLRASALRRALQEYPSAQATLQPLLQTFHTMDLTKPLLPALQCNDAAKVMLSRSSTRHILCPGETIVTQHKRKYEGVILLLRGSVSLQINGVEARRLSDGQVVGEEMLMNVTSKWRYSLCCLTFCDVIVLHRRPFLTLVKDAKPPGSSEEGLECQRLAFLLEGPWREEQVIVSLPLFHGFDSKFLSVLPQLMETRVVMPGNKIWEATPQERSLFLLLNGTADEIITTYKKRRASQVNQARLKGGQGASEYLVRTSRRTLCQGSCEGGAHMLGLRKAGDIHVVARSVVIVAILHREVFLYLLHTQNVKIQAPEVLKMLSEELDLEEDADEEYPTVESLENCMPILRGLDEAFMSSLLRGGSSCFYLEGQQLCPPRSLSESLFVVLRGEVWTEMAGIFLDKYCQGQALHILALAKGFTPSYESRCIRISEVWALPRDVLMTSLDRYPSMKRILASLTSMQVSRLTTVGALETNEDEMPPPTSPSSVTPRGDTSLVSGRPVELETLPLFHGISFEMLNWVQDNLEPRIFFSDSCLFREGDASESFYIVCKGAVSLENSMIQETCGIGASFGEAELLAVSEIAKVTASCLETSLIQVLHRQVFLKGLASFPAEVEHFDQLAVKLLQSNDALNHSPILEGCSENFKSQLAQRCTTRLLRENECLVQKSSTRGCLCVIRSGSAVVEENRGGRPRSDTTESQNNSKSSFGRRFCKWDIVNADLVLGLVTLAPYNVVVDNFCAVTEIQDTDFINILQNFPEEVPILVSRLSGLWPKQVDQVPFLSGMSSAHFEQLLQEGEWNMHMADRTVVRQNREGSALHLLCYGLAVRLVDDVILGNPLAQGEVVGRGNFLGFTKRYPFTVRTQSVCHFRTMHNAQLLKMLETDFPMREWFELAKGQAENYVEYDHDQQKAEIFRAKMRRRTEQAFNKHVRFTRANRAKKEGVLDTKAKQLVEQFLQSTRRSDSPEDRSHRDVSEDWVALQETYAMLRHTPATPALVSSVPARIDPEGNPEDEDTLSGFSGSEHSFKASEQRPTSKQRSTPGSVPVSVVRRRLPGSGSWNMSKPGGLRQIQVAIHSFCREKEKDQLKSRLLRIMRNDYETGNATLEDEDEDSEEEVSPVSPGTRRPPRRLKGEDLQRLDELLPSLETKESTRSDVSTSARSLGRALHRKFQRLTKVTSKKDTAARPRL